MRILYGVVGEGMGHAIRSRVVIDHLIAEEGHEIEVVVSGRAHDVLQSYFPQVHRIWGLSMTYRDNAFKMIRSVAENSKQALTGLPRNIRRYFEITRDFEPQCVITDFESWAYLYGKRHRLPVISIDNIQMINRCRHPRELIQQHEREFSLHRAFVKGKLPGCDHYYITTFFHPEVRKKRTTLVPPVLRPDILQAPASQGDHILVYLTSASASHFLDILHQAATPFRVYGMRRDLTADVVEGNVTLRPFDEQTFIADLASSRAVIANGGFTLLSEAVYLHKPVLSIPVRAQIEQVMNGFYIEQLGYGYTSDELDLATLSHFLDHLDRYRSALAGYEQPAGNGVLFEQLDERLDRLAGVGRRRTRRAGRGDERR